MKVGIPPVQTQICANRLSTVFAVPLPRSNYLLAFLLNEEKGFSSLKKKSVRNTSKLQMIWES